jgi:CBS domain-containing protein
MKVRDIMTAEVASATPDATLEEIATMMKDEDTGVIPVVEDELLLGLVTDRDIVVRCIAEGKSASGTTADDILSEDLETIEPDEDVEEASRLMSRRQIRRLPVVEDGRLVGILSIGDIAVKATEQKAGEALEDVSHGVKPSRGGRPGRARRQSAAIDAPVRHLGVSAEQRLDQERGASRLVSSGRNPKQGIANRNAGEEQRRQSKVVSIRNEGKTTRKRRAS